MSADGLMSIHAVADGAMIDRASSATVILGEVSTSGGGSTTGAGSSASTSSTAALTRLRGSALLSALGQLPASRLTSLLKHHPELVQRLIDHPPAATETALAWKLMPSSGRTALERVSPRLVGSLEGLPYDVRDRANRTELAAEIRAIRARLAAGTGRGVAVELRSRLHMLEQVRAALKPSDALPRHLIALDSRGEGTAAIAIGDLTGADYVSFLVPGMYYGVDARIVPWTQTASRIAAAQRDALDREGRSDAHAAVISWIGYATPTLVDVASMTDARAGGRALAASLQGLNAARSVKEPYVTLLGHSYGATAAMLAVDDGDGAWVDALAIVGSPGSPAAKASELRVRGGNVWVGAAPWDPIAQSGVFGSQPASAGFGAHEMGVTGSRDPSTGRRTAGAVSHNDYFADDSETIRNFALIGIGADSNVTLPDGRTWAQASS